MRSSPHGKEQVNLETTEENKHDVADRHKDEAQSPWKNLEARGQFPVFTKN